MNVSVGANGRDVRAAGGGATLTSAGQRCCTEQQSGRNRPYPVPGSSDADGVRASQFQRAVQGINSDRHLGCPTLVHHIRGRYHATRTAKWTRTRFFEYIRTITAYRVFPGWTTLTQTLIDSKPRPNIEAQITK